jgi:hypothetical protein
MKSLRAFLLVFCASTMAFAGDNEFRGVVHAIEGRYGVRHTHIPLLGFAMFFVRPEGVSGLKLAVFENFNGPTEPDDVSRIVENSLGAGWYPFVRVQSKSDAAGGGETTLIYASPSGGKLRMMIVNVESSEATVVELKLSERAIKQWLKEPGEQAEGQSGHRRHPGDD